MISEAAAVLHGLGVESETSDVAVYIMDTAKVLRDFLPDKQIDALLIDSGKNGIKNTIRVLEKLIESLPRDKFEELQRLLGLVKQRVVVDQFRMSDDRLLATVGASDWEEIALCFQTDPDIFENDESEGGGWRSGSALKLAREICGKCVVQGYCVKRALDLEVPLSPWVRVAGGLSRRQLVKRRRDSQKAS